MKKFNKKVLSIILVAAMAVPFVACEKANDSSAGSLNSAGSNNASNDSIDDSVLEQLMGAGDDSGNVPLVFTYNGEVVKAGEPGAVETGNSGDNSSSTDSNSNSASSSTDSKSDSNSDSSSSDASQGSYTEDKQKSISMWYDISNQDDYYFEGDLMTITFKVKDNTPTGIYDVGFKTLDFSNYAGEVVNASGVAGSVAVGQAAEDNSAEVNKQSGFIIYGSNETAQAGDTVTYTIKAANNPGIAGLILAFEYDANALEIVQANYGQDFSDAIAK